MTGQDTVERQGAQFAAFHDDAAFHEQGVDPRRRAKQERGYCIACAAVAKAAEIEHGDVGALANRERTDVVSSQAARTLDGGHAQCIAHADRARAMAETLQQQALADFGEHGMAAAVFDNVMEKGGDRLVFVASGFEDQGGDGHEMGDVRDGDFLTRLMRVLFGGEEEGVVKARSEVVRHRRCKLRASSLNPRCLKERLEDTRVTKRVNQRDPFSRT